MKFRLFGALLIVLACAVSTNAGAAEEVWEYTFRPGDSLWKIAQKYTTTADNWSTIRSINSQRLGPNRQIPPGTRIVIPVSMLKVQPTPAKVIAVNGDARLVRANGEQDELEIGTLLYSGDRVLTADGQTLRLQFADESELQVLSNSEIVLDKLSHHQRSGMVDTRVRLNSGNVNTWVRKQKKDSHYEIRTPAALTAVRGTAFRLSSDANQISRVEVSEGLVGVSAGGIEKAVKEGFGLVAEKGKPLQEPVKLLPPPQISDNLSTDKSVLQLSWLKMDGALYYRYQLAADEQFNQMRYDQTTENTMIKIPGLEAGRYFVRVRGIDLNRLEGADSTRDYQIQQAPVEDDSLRKVIIPVGTLLIVQ